MYPRGSNGSAQAILDARTLADRLAAGGDPRPRSRPTRPRARRRRPGSCAPTASIPPDFIILRVEELVGDRPFDDLDRYITQAELKELSDRYKRVAGFAREDVA